MTAPDDTARAALAARKRELLRRKLEAAGLAADGDGAERIPPREQRSEVPLSFAQSRMWFLQQLDPASPAYNVCLAITLRGQLDVPALSAAIRQLATRHEVLRTRYVCTDDGVPRQVIDREPRVRLPVTDLRDIPAGQRRQRADELARQDAALPFELSTEHSIRVSLLHLGAEEYVLVLTVHHIAWDGGTFNALSADLSALYRAELGASGGELDPVPAQYADAACWQNRKWTDEQLAGQLGYWRAQLDPPPDPLPLPTDAARGPVPGEHGGRRRRDFGQELTSRLTEFCRRAGLTPFMVLYAGFVTVLHRYTGSEDVPVGSATMNRDVAGLERLIGNFGNTLVLRADLSGDPTFHELLRRVQRLCADGYANQDVPFDKLVEELRPPRHRGRSVFFDVMLLFLTQGLRGPDFPGVHAEWETVHNDTCQFDLALEAFMTGGRLRIEATYRSELFEPETIDRVLAHLETLLSRAIEDPDRPVSWIDVLGETERQAILRQGTGAAEELPPSTLLELFETQVRRTPDAPAIACGSRVLSYAELNTRANQLARRLAEFGVRPECRVGIHLERSAEMVAGMLAVLKAGGAFVPVEPSWPHRRIAEVCHSAGLTVVVSEPGPQPALEAAGIPVLKVALDGSWPDELDGTDRGEVIDPEGLAYVIYTSGSTGVPKGAMIRHRAIAHRLVWQRGVLGGFGTGDAALFKAPLGFDISINEVFLPLSSGGCVVVAEPGGERDNEYLLELIRRHAVTFVYIPSSMLDLLLQLDDFAEHAASLRHVWCGGEVLTAELFDRFRARSDAVMYHGYGPAEATIGVSHVIYRTNDIRRVTSIGGPNTNTELYVLDRALRPVPTGVAGELYAGGVYLGRGYVNDPARTAQHFVANPFGAAGSRLYRTGDLARWTASGELEFLGRADNQVKIRGMRVELEEIEAILERHEQVRRAVVVVRDDTPGTHRLVGYCVATEPGAGTDDLASRVRGWAQERVPEHMVPQALTFLDEFPLMPSGKVDRKRLPEVRILPVSTSRAPADERERVLCGLFAEVLGLADVGAEDDFFRLGGDSIVAVQLVSRARKAGIVFTPRQVFEHPSPEGLAGVVGVLGSGRSRDDEAEPGTAVGAAELTPIMHRTRSPGGSFGGLNQTVLLRTPHGMTLEGLAATVRAVLDRHDVLRARLESQALAVPPPGTLDAEDLITRVPGLPGSVDEITEPAADARARLNPDAGAMLRLVWFDAGEHAQGRLLIVAHHLVVDWVSWSILTTDLAEAWRAWHAGTSAVLPRSGTSFRRWTQVLCAAAREPGRVRLLDYWRHALDGADPGFLERPLDPARDVTSTVCHAGISVPPERAAALLSVLPGAYYTGVPEVLLTGLTTALAALGHTGPLPIGLEGHGRAEHIAEGTEIVGDPDIAGEVDLSSTVGWFTTYFPVRLDLGEVEPSEVCRGAASAGTAIKHIKEQVRGVPERGIGYGLLRHLNPDTAPVLGALSEPAVSFNYLGTLTEPDDKPWQLAPETATFRLPPEGNHPVTSALDINALAVEHGGSIRLDITVAWPEAVATRATVEELLARWDEALRGLSEHAARADAGGHTPSDLPLVSLTQDDIDELERDEA